MKNLFLFLFLFVCVYAEAQVSKVNYSLYKKLHSSFKTTEEKTDVLVQGNIGKIRQITESEGGVFKYSSGDIASVSISFSGLKLLLQEKDIVRAEENETRPEPLNDQVLLNTNVVPVHLGIPPLVQGYDGAGVVVGIIDTGVDFDHPDFKDINGKSRIKYMWIHELKGAGAPQPYNYGREFTNADIDQGLAVHAKDEYHGTHVTGIAAGNGLAVNNYKGVAPNADIIVVSIDFAAGPANSVVDAVDYIYKKAAAMGKPCVINASLGFSEGSHDATDLQSRLIEHLITDKSGRSFVCAAGNSGNIPFHLGCSVNQDTSFTWFKSKNGGISFHLYSDSADFKELQFAIGADQVTPNFSFRGKTIFRNLKSLVDTTIRDTIYYQGKKIAVAEYFTELIDTGKTYLSSITIYPDSTAYYYRLISTGKGKFDVWNNYMVFDNLPDEALFPDIKSYKLPDINQTIVSSFTCSDKVITVGNLVNRTTYTDVNGTIYNDQSLNKGELYVTSSKGPTRRGLIKPDIVASGTNVLSCLPLSMIPSSVVSNPTKVAAGGKHIRNGGTSMASPVVAGVVALYFEKNPNASWKEVKDSLLSSAKRDKYTGNNLPNNYYGYGKVDAWRLFNPPVPQVQTGISESNTNTSLGIYPNPVAENSELIYHISQNTSQGNYFIRFSDILGKEVKRMGLTEGTGVIQLEASEFKAGVYYVSVMNGSKSVTTKKMIVLK